MTGNNKDFTTAACPKTGDFSENHKNLIASWSTSHFLRAMATPTILGRVNFGYEHLEPLVLGLAAYRNSFLLIGRHGTGKTRLAKHLSMGWGDEAFGFYDATKDDLISIAGMPDPEGMKAGALRFIPHQRSIWNKKAIVVDEITRAAKENQNLWLEIIEEHKCFGLPLPYEMLIATANPESYAAAFQLDEALLDRFYAVIPVPEMQDRVRPEDVNALLQLSMGKIDPIQPAEMLDALDSIRNTGAEFQTEEVIDSVQAYVSAFVPIVLRLIKEQNAPYLSPRSFGRNFPETILATAAALAWLGDPEPLVNGARIAGIYCIATRLQLKPSLIEQIHTECLGLLQHQQASQEQQLRAKLASLSRFEDKIRYLRESWHLVTKYLKPDEREKEVGDLVKSTMEKGDRDRLVALHQFLHGVDYKGDAMRQVEGKLTILLSSALDKVQPVLARFKAEAAPSLDPQLSAQFEHFTSILSDKDFLSSTDEGLVEVKRFLIDIWEGDIPSEPAAFMEFLQSLPRRPAAAR